MKRVLLLLLLAGCSTTTKNPVELTPLPTAAPPSTVVITTPQSTTTTTLSPEAVAYLETLAAWQAQVDVMMFEHPRCAEWLPLLLEVGGKIEDWPIWSRILWVESRCIDGLEGNGSIGLAQIQWSVHKEWALQMGITRDMMLTARPNLTFAVRLQQASGWSPWRYLNLP
jgi:hypothetical protein